MLTLSSCPQCRHVFPVSATKPDSGTGLPVGAVPFSRPDPDRRTSFDHHCNDIMSSNLENQYDSNSYDSNSDLNEDCYYDWNDEDYDSMEAENDAEMVTYREHVSTKRPISNRLV